MTILPFLRGRGFARPLAQACPGADTHTDAPQPIPRELSVIRLPADHYLHRDAPTEWWWHIGTLKAGDRVFGFEINAASFQGRGFGFSQIMLTDVAAKKHYQRTTTFTPPAGYDPATWAEHDVNRDWRVRLGDPNSRLTAIKVTNPGSGYDPVATTVTVTGGGGSQAIAYPLVDPTSGAILSIQLTNPGRGYTSPPHIVINGKGSGATAEAVHTFITMDAAWGDPTQNMAVVSKLTDDATDTEVVFDLTLSQKGAPFVVWGTGVTQILPPASGSHLQTGNYYYSLTNVAAAGTITIDGEIFEVEGKTWMDHEYGFFGTAQNPVKWILQNAQLDNGWSLSNHYVLAGGNKRPNPGEPVPCEVTLQDPEGQMYVVPGVMTAERPWTSPASGVVYYLDYQLDIAGFDAVLNFKALLADQEFPLPTGSIYEGIASAEGSFQGKPASGTGWIEQAL
ncbi:lipocalin-like domain-containing protein [Caulobacter sp. CCNWLY153]|uniref:lipocalin-like domain-containing protein n=1 Tax=unclassified Caulobacter TaxID=2648921 RepID=UPI002FF04309